MSKKKAAIFASGLLLIWFLLDMFGVKIGDKYLVEGAFKDDGIFMIIFIFTFLFFVFTKKVGKYIYLTWLIMWFVAQFLSHEWYTIFGKGLMGNVDDKIEYFKDCIKLVDIQGRYVPDLYHTVLHILLIIAIITIFIGSDKNKEKV